MDEATLAGIAAGFGVDETGRAALWRERLSQDLPSIEAVRRLDPDPAGPVSSGRKSSGTGRSGRTLGQNRAGYAWDRRGGESITERVEQALDRIEANAGLNAFIRVFPREALADARLLDERLAQGEDIGPFGGAIVGVKDIMGVRGAGISAGMASLDFGSGTDSLVVARLRAAGGIIVGSLNLHPLAYGPFSTGSDFGPVHNPLNTAVVAGGSSGGSAAAVAAGLVDIAIGTDTAGSIRMPAALCGVVGLKPTYSLVPRDGAQPLAPSLDHIGPLARTVPETQAALNAMLGFRGSASKPVTDRRNSTRPPLEGITVGLTGAYAENLLAPPVRTAFEHAKDLVRKLGARVETVRLPTLAAAPGLMLCTLGPEALDTFRDLLRHRAGMLASDVRLRLEAGMFIPATDYVHCQLLRQDLRREIDAAFDQVDLILTPTLPVTAPLLTEIDGNPDTDGGVPLRAAMNRLTLPFNLSGHPALSLPFAADERGAGIGMQLVGARHADTFLLAQASIIEANTPRPPTLPAGTPERAIAADPDAAP